MYASSTEPRTARVVVVGDSGVGKTTLIQHICNTGPIKPQTWTVGCSIDVVLHSYKGVQYFIEFLDVSGSIKYKLSRKSFYDNIDGLLLVHDVLNKRSYSNLKTWTEEVLGTPHYQWSDNATTSVALFSSPSAACITQRRSDEFGFLGGSGSSRKQSLLGAEEHTLELVVGDHYIPTIIVGNKAPAGAAVVDSSLRVNTSSMVGFEESSIEMQTIRAFFDHVIERKYFIRPSIPKSPHVNINMEESPHLSPSSRRNRESVSGSPYTSPQPAIPRSPRNSTTTDSSFDFLRRGIHSSF